jgi:cobalt/nickel transport system permease protein
MHMADALLSPAVGGVMCAVRAASVAYSAAKIKKDELSEKKVPVMAVTGAFVFAAQMINFTIPATGSSGHIGGGILLSAILGPFPALLSIAAVLIIQCLFFADGGLLALGCNIFNLGVIPCLIVCPLIYRPIVRKGNSVKRISAASIITVLIRLQLGAFAVILQRTGPESPNCRLARSPR